VLLRENREGLSGRRAIRKLTNSEENIEKKKPSAEEKKKKHLKIS